MHFNMIPCGRIKSTLAALLLGFGVMMFGAGTDARAEEGELIDRIVAQVNDDVITLYELNRKAAPYLRRIKAMARPLDEERRMIYDLREKVLNQMVDEKLTEQEIRRFNIRVSEEAIDKTIEEMKKRTLMTDQQLRASLEKEGLSMDEYRERMKNQILRVRLVNREVKSKIVITDEDIRTYYDNHSEDYVGTGNVHLRQIFLAFPLMAQEAEKQALRDKMDQIRRRAMEGTPFETLARENPKSPGAEDGGELGTFQMNDLAPQILKALEGLQAGDVTKILETDKGLQVFYIETLDKGEGKPLEEVSADIEDILYDEIVNQKFMTWLTDLRQRSHIKIIR